MGWHSLQSTCAVLCCGAWNLTFVLGKVESFLNIRPFGNLCCVLEDIQLKDWPRLFADLAVPCKCVVAFWSGPSNGHDQSDQNDFLMNAACPIVTGSIISTSDGLFQVSQLFWSYIYADVPRGQAPTGLFSANLKRWIAFGTTWKKKNAIIGSQSKLGVESNLLMGNKSTHPMDLNCSLKSFWMW